MDHALNTSKTVTNIAARNVLKKAGRCFICLTNRGSVNATDPSSNKFPYSKGCKELPTDAALLPIDSKPTCTYCTMDHALNTSKTVTNIAARNVLKKAGRCFICLKRNHIGKDCMSRITCLKCGHQHHVSICTEAQAMELSHYKPVQLPMDWLQFRTTYKSQMAIQPYMSTHPHPFFFKLQGQ